MITGSLKQSIYNALLSDNLSEIDLDIVASLLYQYIKSAIQNNNSEMSNIDTLITKYKTTYISNLTNYKSLYVSYHTLENYINQLENKNFISLP